MRLVATSDTHTVVNLAHIPDGDVFVHAGDLMSTGYLDDWRQQLSWLEQLPHKHKFYVPGNHDYHIFNYRGPALQELRKIGVVCLGLPGNERYYSATLPNGLKIGGSPYVMGLKGWAFNESGLNIGHYVLNELGPVDIMVTHSPIYGIMDQLYFGGHNVGVESYVEYLKRYKPQVWIHGHVHECYGYHLYEETGTQIFNVSMCDRKYRHVNKPLVLDF